jgi:helicase MOV-10
MHRGCLTVVREKGADCYRGSSISSTMVKICPKLQSQGACSDQACQYRHDVRICEDCGIICTSADIYRAHLQGKRHKRQLLGLVDIHYCSLCSMNVMGLWTEHLSTKRHLKNANQQGVSVSVDPVEASENGYCAICRKPVMPRKQAKHLQSPKHRMAEKYVAYKATLEEAEKNKHGVIVSDVLDFGIIARADAHKSVSIPFVIQTVVPTSRITVDSFKLSSTTASSP